MAHPRRRPCSLFDSGFHHARWFKEWTIDNYLSPDDAVRLAGVTPEAVTDIVVSHAHWDHLGGIDLFPNAGIWIQRRSTSTTRELLGSLAATTTASIPRISPNS